MLNKIIKYFLYGLVFLFPLFFLPITIFPVTANKQILVSVFVFLLLLFWLIKTMTSGKISFIKNKLTATILLFILIQGLSTIFSGSQVQSFWGTSFESDSFFSFLLCVLGFFIASNFSSPQNNLGQTPVKKNNGGQTPVNLVSQRGVMKTFLISNGILAIFFLAQLVMGPIFSWDFAQKISFNSVGTVQTLSILFGSALVILITLINNNKDHQHKSAESASISGKTILKKITSILPIAIGILLFISILLINFKTTWLLLILGMILIIWFRLKQIDPGANLASSALVLPFIILALSLIFIFINIPTQELTNLPAEVGLTNKASFDISQKTLQASKKNLFLGSGPATFGYNYDLYHSQGINFTDFWGFRFEQGKSFILTQLANSGLLGLISILLLIIAFFWQSLISINQPNQYKSASNKSAANTAVFVASAYFLISWFFYPTNFVLIFTAFLFLGLYQGQSAIKQRKSVAFTKSPQLTFFVMLLGVFLLVGLIVGIYKIGERYAGEVVYAQALEIVNSPERDLDNGIVKIMRAIELAPGNDNYYRNLSEIFLLKISDVVGNEELSEEQKKEFFQALINNIQSVGETMVQINPLNNQNWFQLGVIYENFIFLGIKGSEGLAINSYQKASELTPQNPQFVYSLGRTYKLMAERIGEEDESYQGILDLAISELEKTLQLKPDFTPASQLLEEIENSD